MKKFKPFVIPLLTAIFTGLQSCDDKHNREAEILAAEEPLKVIAIEINQKKETYQFIESVFKDTNNEFLRGDYLQSIPQRMRTMQVAVTEDGDTIRNADEIPVYSSEDINQKIFVDGTYKYLNLNTTPADSNAFNDLNVYKQPVSEIVTKTILMDGVAYLYNQSGELIQTEATGDLNYTAMLDSIRNAIADADKSGTSPQGVKAMHDRRLAKAINSAKASGMRIISETDDEIVMEMNFNNAGESTLPRRVKSPVQTRAVMRFSGDMTRMLEQKMYENEQLVQMSTYQYRDDNEQFSLKAPAAVKSFFPNATVKGITYKSLKVRSDGTPYIMVTTENYKKNQVSVNL
jgi:hypothetical protein